MIKKLIKAFIDTCKDPHLFSSRPHHGKRTTFTEYPRCPHCGDYVAPLDWCGCTDPKDKNYKGNPCPNCGNSRMKCTCDLQGLSDSEKELTRSHTTSDHHDLSNEYNCIDGEYHNLNKEQQDE